MAKQRKFACQFCNHEFAQIRKHIKSVHKNIQKLMCNDCNYATNFSAELETHIATLHDKMRSRNHICGECGKGFFKKQVMQLHMKTIHGQIKFECQECGKSFSQKGNLSRHVEIVHRGIRDNFCELCDFTASTKRI